MVMFKENIIKISQEISSMKKDRNVEGLLRLISRLLGVILIIYSLGYMYGGWLASGIVDLDGVHGTIGTAVMAILISFLEKNKAKETEK